MADNIIRVFGHTNPDTDSISCAITMANLQNQIGREAQSFRLGEINKETQYALNVFGLEEPELLSNIDNNVNVINFEISCIIIVSFCFIITYILQ